MRPFLTSPILLGVLGGKLARDQVAYINYTDEQLTSRKALEESFTATGKENPRKDFIYYLLHAKDPQTGKGFNKEELDADTGLLISAGADTTGTTLSAAFFCGELFLIPR